MIKVIEDWLGDSDLVRYLDRLFTYKTPHNYIEYADSSNAPKTIFGRYDEQETESQIFYSADFSAENPLIKFLVIKAMDSIEDHMHIDQRTLICERVHLAIQHPFQDIEWHRDGGKITAVYTAACPGGGDFIFSLGVSQQIVEFKKNKLILFDGDQKHMALAPKSKRPRILLVMKFNYHIN